jgi:hypothetical protein
MLNRGKCQVRYWKNARREERDDKKKKGLWEEGIGGFSSTDAH